MIDKSCSTDYSPFITSLLYHVIIKNLDFDNVIANEKFEYYHGMLSIQDSFSDSRLAKILGVYF